MVALIVALIAPYISGLASRVEEKKHLARVLHAVEQLKRKSFSYIQGGKISREGKDLVFSLGEEEVERIAFSHPVELEKEIRFNPKGITGGGEIRLTYGGSEAGRGARVYRVEIGKIWGRLSLERADEDS